MLIWHNTPDASRIPEYVAAGQEVELWIGTHPIEDGQSVWLEMRLQKADGKELSAKVPVQWHSNNYQRNNSYWRALLGTFEAGDRVEYVVHGSVRDEQVSDPSTYAFEVS